MQQYRIFRMDQLRKPFHIFLTNRTFGARIVVAAADHVTTGAEKDLLATQTVFDMTAQL